MRVMHFAPYTPPDRMGEVGQVGQLGRVGRVGGVGRFTASLHAGLVRRGVDSSVVTSGRRGSRDSLDAREGVHRIAATRLGWFLGMLAWTRRAAACDVVHCHSGEALSVLLALRLWPGRRAKLVVTFHSSAARIAAVEERFELEGRVFAEPLLRRLSGRVMVWLHEAVDVVSVRAADCAFAVCRATALDLFGPLRGAALRVVHNGVAEAGTGEAADPVELLFVGSGRPCKRAMALPFVLRGVREEVPEARLRIAGLELEAVPGLRDLFAELGVESAVECVGEVGPDELARHYRAARVLVLPSAHEGLPYVLLEAMAAGLPVVATRVGGHAEAVADAREGFLVDPDAPRALAERCVTLLGDRARAERMGAAARSTASERFGLERQVDATLGLYRELIS